MSILNDAEDVNAVITGGTDRSALVYDSNTHTWYTKNQAGTQAPLVNGVSSFNTRTGAVTPQSGDYASFYDAAGAAAAAQAASQPLDATLTSLAAHNWATDALPIGSGADTVAQVAFAANTFPAKASSGALVAKPMTDLALSLVADTTTASMQSTLGLGSAATQSSSAFDAAGAAAAAQAASQPLDATLTALAAADWAANALPIGTGSNTLSQTAFAANTFPARASTGSLVAKAITDYAIVTLLALSDAVGLTALINVASTTLKGLISATDQLHLNSINLRVFRPGDYSVGNTFDPTGATDSTSSFSAMRTAVVAFNDRCVIELPAGVFKVDNAQWDYSAVTAPFVIAGRDRSTTVIIPNQTTGDIIKLHSGGDGVSLRDFSIFQTGGPNTTGAGINTNGCNDVLIEKMSFVNLFNDIFVNGGSIKVSMQRLTHFQTNGSATSVGILVTNGAAGDTYIGPDVVMSNTGATRRRASVEITQTGHYEINQCNLTGSQQGILIDPGAGLSVAFGFHNEVLCDSCTVNGMTVNAASSTSTIKNIKSVNSWYSGTITGGGAGVVTTGTAGGIINGMTFTSDRFLNNQTHGFQHGFGTDIRFEGCDMKGNSQSGSALADGLNVAAAVSNWSVRGGKFGGSDTVPTAVNQRYGINVLAGAGTSIVISPDDASGNVTGPLFNGATGVVHLDRFVGMAPIAVVPAANAVTSGTSETVILSLRVPAGSAYPSQTFGIRLHGISSSTGTLIFRIRAGPNGTTADTQLWISSTTAAQVANSYATIYGQASVKTTGTTGTINGHAFGEASAVLISNAVVALPATSINMNNDWFIDVTCTCSVGTFTAFVGCLEPLH